LRSPPVGSVMVGITTIPGRGAPRVDGSVRGGDFPWPRAGTFVGHQRGPHLATSGDFLMATRRCRPRPSRAAAPYELRSKFKSRRPRRS
jgi:hypothetical protein